MNLRPVNLTDDTPLQCEFYLETTGQYRFQYSLIAKFIGKYREGSAGSPDAHYILGMAKAGVEVWTPAAIILDFSELDYEWGDEMDWFLPPDINNLPAAVVVGPECTEAIASLLWGRDTKQPATDVDFVFDTLVQAWEYVRRQRQVTE